MNLQYQKNNDKFIDFAGIPYKPLCDIKDMLKSSNIFINSITNSEHDSKLKSLFSDLKDETNVVWQIKNINGDIEWEIYFYKKPNDTFEYYKKIVNKYFILPDVDEQNMFNQNSWPACWSFDVPKKSKVIDTIDFYGGDIAPNQSKCSYVLSYIDGEYTHKNSYVLYRPHMDKDLDFMKDKFLIPEFMEWYKNTEQDGKYSMYYSQKPKCESVYYGNLSVDLLLFFLEKFNYPKNQINFIKKYGKKLSHLEHGIAIDYKKEGNEFKVVKTGYYGTI